MIIHPTKKKCFLHLKHVSTRKGILNNLMAGIIEVVTAGGKHSPTLVPYGNLRLASLQDIRVDL